MFDQFLHLAGAAPDAVAVIDGQSAVVTTRRALLEQSLALAEDLAAAGIRARDSLAVQLPNCAEFVAAVLAAAKLDVVIVPIDRNTTDTEVAKILSHFCIRALLYRPDRGSDLTVSTRTVTSAPAVPADARLLKLTSGSTGSPRAIVTTEANLVADCSSICSTMGITSTDINFGAIPFSHSYGFSNLVMPLLMQGTAVVASNDYLPHSVISLANAHRCTVAPLIPLVLEHLSHIGSGRFETVRTFISAGAPLSPATSRRFHDRFGLPVHSFYGCSECGGITYDRRGGAVERGSVGEPMDGVEISKIGDRLHVRSRSVAAGSLLDADTFEPFEAGTFRTDDLIEVHEGEILLTGRHSDLINTAGRKVDPREVEAVIAQIPGVRQVKVFGQPAGARGEIVAAAIVATPEISPEYVRAYCRERLSLHKVPRVVKLLDELPTDERGKIRREALLSL